MSSRPSAGPDVLLKHYFRVRPADLKAAARVLRELAPAASGSALL